MEALRKAEQQKRQAAAQQNAAPAATDTLELAPLPGQDATAAAATEAADAQGRLPELPTRLEDLDAQFFTQDAAAVKASRPTAGSMKRPPQADTALFRSQPAGDAAAREAAQNLFAAKRADSGGRFGFAITVGGLTVVAVVAIGGYLYWQLQPKGGLAAGPALVAAVPAVPAAAPAFSAPAPQAPQQPAAPPAQPLPMAPPADALPAAPAAAERGPEAIARPARPPTAPPAPAPDAPIRLSATAEKKAMPALERAHLAFDQGETGLARAAWQQVLQSDRRNPDALRGLAILAQQEGRPELALDYYLRVLEVDPKDAQAIAGVLSLKGQANPQLAESRLKTLLAEQPDSSYLNFALGNLYAQGARWAEAQQAFFQAHVADPANPDILYNLAVSLDHLHQARLAAQYYAQALEAADRRRAGFDQAQAAARLKVLRE